MGAWRRAPAYHRALRVSIAGPPLPGGACRWFESFCHPAARSTPSSCLAHFPLLRRSPSRQMRTAAQRSSIRSGRTSSRPWAPSSTARPAAALPRVLVYRLRRSWLSRGCHMRYRPACRGTRGNHHPRQETSWLCGDTLRYPPLRTVNPSAVNRSDDSLDDNARRDGQIAARLQRVKISRTQGSVVDK
jgi:hypothetical protein